MSSKVIGYSTIVHPLPSVAMTLTALVLSLPLNITYSLDKFLAFGLIILLENFIVGLVNDLRDFPYDLEVKPYKPLVAGSITSFEAKMLLVVFFIVLFVAFTAFNFAIDLIFLLGLGCGLSYDLLLKNTPFSFVPYAIAMPTLAIAARLVNGNFPVLLLWIYPLGALMSLALHLTNQMNKAEESNKSGEHNLLQIIGVKNGQLLCVLVTICSLVLFTFLSLHFDLNAPLMDSLDLISMIFIGVFIVFAKIGNRKVLFPLTVISSAIMGTIFIQMIL